MSDIAIRVENLGKSYQITHAQGGYRTLQEDLRALVKRPFNRGTNAPRKETFWALKDISFEVKHGEVLGIIGRNGAGKSTLLKILSRITKPTTGHADIYGRVGSLLEVGTGFHPELTGRENIFLNGAVLGMSRRDIQARFDEIVTFAEVEQFLDTPVKRYSSGMYMRLAFAVAAHMEPEVLVVDEVLAVGDAAFQKKSLGKMENVAKSGRTVLFVSHNLAVINQICSEAILLDHGNIIQKGNARDVVQAYVGIAAANSNLIEIKPSDHANGIQSICVKSVRLVNGVEGAFAIGWRQPIKLQLEIKVLKFVQSINFGIGIGTVDGVAVFNVHNSDDNGELTTLVAGTYLIDIEVSNPLRLGVYNLFIGAHEGIAKTSLFYIPNAIRLEVVSSKYVDMAYNTHNTGIVNGDSTWLIRPISEMLPSP